MSRHLSRGGAALAVLALTTACAAPLASGPADRSAERPADSAVMTATPAALAALSPCEDLPALPTARCGSVTVPLDRSDPGSPLTEVAFALVPRTDTSRPGLGTVVPNPGGPGTSTIDATGELFTQALAPLADRRDVLLVDPRGVGRSDLLTCPALEGPDQAFADLAAQRAAIGACGEELGGRAGAYGTAAVADDVDAVREALGVDRLDLLGVSYGTFLMPVYAERHPEHVRTVTMAGAYAVHDDPMTARGPEALRRAVQLTCESTGTCSAEQVLSDLAALAERLRTEPDAVDVAFEGTEHRVVLDEWQLASAAGRVFSKEADPAGVQALADAASAARGGDLAPLRAFVAAGLTASAQDATSGAVSVAQSWATTCHDYVRPFDATAPPAQREAQLEAAVDGLDDAAFAPFSARAWTTRADFDAGACVQWPADAGAQAPFAPGTDLPDVPVLVLNGDLDANTTSAAGREAAAQFPDATFVEVPGAGHTPATTAEGLGAILAFISEGTA